VKERLRPSPYLSLDPNAKVEQGLRHLRFDITQQVSFVGPGVADRALRIPFPDIVIDGCCAPADHDKSVIGVGPQIETSS